MKKMICLVAILGLLFASNVCPAGFGGIWKSTPGNVNFWISEHDTGSMTVVVTPDARTYQSYLDSDFSDGFNAGELGGDGSTLSITFSSDTQAKADLTPSGGDPVSYALTKDFGGVFCGLVFSSGGIFSDPNGLAYRATASSPYGAVKYTTSSGSDLVLFNDSFVRAHNGNVYVVGRFNSDSVTVLDAVHTQGNPLANYSVGKTDPGGNFEIPSPQASTNPQDLEFISDSVAYMSFLGSPAILKLNPLTGQRLGLIDISGFTQGVDGLPEANQMVRVGEFLYVILQQLDQQNAFEPLQGLVIKIHTLSDTVMDLNPLAEGMQGIALQRKNPGNMVYLEDTKELFVQCVGSYSDAEVKSGIEVIDTTTDTSKGLRVTEEAAGLQIANIALCNAAKGYLLGYDVSFNSIISEFNPTSGEMVQNGLFQANYFIEDIKTGCLSCGCTLFTTDRSDADPGIIAIDTKTNAIAGKGATDLPMHFLSILER
ncbi:MAG: hypothetical protein HY788_03400 [Deltaproteobacteria bacterium]|nr:hypothetical protein [Deltaproteobacteria bacterium]